MTQTTQQLLSRVVGDAMSLFGGTRMTRLTQQTQVGDTQLLVERTAGFAATGSVIVDAVRYSYTGMTAAAFTGISVVRGGNAYAGAQAVHVPLSAVIDANRTYSTLQQIKATLFLDSATGDDLTIIGQNLSVPRLPVLSGDDQYRQLIKAVAYGARGTVATVKDALTALLGANNFQLIEDPTNYPAQVVIRAPYSSMYNSTTAGRSYLTGTTAVTSTGNTVPAVANALCTYALTLADENVYVPCTAAPPDQATFTPAASGDASSNYFTYFSNSHGAAGGSVAHQGNSYYTNYGSQVGWYSSTRQPARITTDGRARISLVAALGSTANLNTSDGRYFALSINDGATQYLLGTLLVSGAAVMTLINPSNGAAIAGCPTLPLPSGVFSEIVLEKNGKKGTVTFSINGQRVSMPSSAMVASTATPQVGFGNYNAAYNVHGGVTYTYTGPALQLRGVYVYAHSDIDYTCAQGNNITANGNLLTASVAEFAASDLGNTIVVSGSAINRSGGNNNGTYTITFVQDASNVQVQGPSGAASVSYNGVLTTAARAFTYPDDLGKVVQITGPVLNGSFTIADVYDPTQPTVSLKSYSTALRQTSNSVLLANVTAADGNTTFVVQPTLQQESGLSFVMGNAAAIAGGKVTSRNALPITPAPYNMRADVVNGCQLFGSDQIFRPNNPNGPTPAATLFPLYLTDPLGSVEGYINNLLAAGIVPVFQLT